MTAPDVFLSYNREDQAVARRFAEAFAAEGLNVWWDATLRSGEAYDEVTEAALRGAKAVVVLWSPRSVVSRWVRAEATIADRCKTLVPVMIEACERPIMFELTQTAELSHWTGDAGDRAWQAFLGDVRGFVGREAPSPVSYAPPSAPPKPGERGEAPTLAVLPFANRSGLPDDEVFAIGMVEDVIDALSQGAAVNTLSSSATARFRTGAIPDLAALARDLDVRYVLEGNVRRVGESLRVTAQLVEPASGRIVWTQKFDRPLSELAVMQEALVVEVAGQLDANVDRLEVERTLRKPGELTAWEATTRAINAYDEFTPAALERAAELAAQAVAIDPDYALALSVLALSRGVVFTFLTPDDPTEVVRIRATAERALKLEPANPQVLAYAAFAYAYIAQPRLALAHAGEAVRLSPCSAIAAVAHGLALTLHNRTDAAVEAFDKAFLFTKGSRFFTSNMGWKAIALMRGSRWAEAEAVEDELLFIYPAANYGLMHKAILCQRDGRIGEAQVFAQRVREADPDISLEIWELRMSRWHQNSPTLDVVLDNLRAVWAATERDA